MCRCLKLQNAEFLVTWARRQTEKLFVLHFLHICYWAYQIEFIPYYMMSSWNSGEHCLTATPDPSCIRCRVDRTVKKMHQVDESYQISEMNLDMGWVSIQKRSVRLCCIQLQYNAWTSAVLLRKECQSSRNLGCALRLQPSWCFMLSKYNLKAGLCWFAFSAHPYFFYDRRDGQLKMPRNWRDGFFTGCQLSSFFKDTLYTNEKLVSNAIMNRGKELNVSFCKIDQCTICHWQAILEGTFLQRLPNNLIWNLSHLRDCLALQSAQCTTPFFTTFSYDVLPVHRITKPGLRTAPFVALDDDGNVPL